jgi:hypothetical protein
MSVMNSPVKSGAAWRVRRPAELTAYDLSPEPAPAPTPRQTAPRENLYHFPSIGIPPRRSAPAEAPPSLARLDDLAAELETALMNDLNKLAPFWGDEAPAMEPSRPGQLRLPLLPDDHAMPASASKDELPQSDRLAVELLLARGRSVGPMAAPVQPRVEAAALQEDLAEELAARLSAAVDELKIAEGEPLAPIPALALSQPRRFAVSRPLVAGIAAILLVAGGAFLTVQSLTENPETPIAAEGLATPAVDRPADEAPAFAIKQSYERAQEDTALAEAPQLRGADLMLPAELLPGTGSTGDAAPVEPSVRAAYAMPPATAADSPAVAAIADAARAASEREATPAPAVSTPDEPAAPSAAAAGDQPGTARIASSVRLRGKPDNGAPTVGYLQKGTEVRVMDCKGWCEVVAGEKRGFVFKRFLTIL